VPPLLHAQGAPQQIHPALDVLCQESAEEYTQGLAGVGQRATARGFGAAANQPELETWVEGDYRYTRLASGVVVKDSLATAPLR
jgi:hypothetical protein